MALAMAVTTAASAGNGELIPLPPRPAAVVEDDQAKQKATRSSRVIKERAPRTGNVGSSLAERRPSTWRRQSRLAPPAVILKRPGAPIRPDQSALAQQAVATPNGPWPVIILAAAEPIVGRGARRVEFDKDVFKADPNYDETPYEREAQVEIYGGKTAVDAQRPIIELGEPFYQVGPLNESTNILGSKNLVFGHLYAFGDWRTAVAYNDNGNGDEVGQIATRLNLDVDLGLTATERLHALFQPLQEDGQFTRCEFFGDGSIDDCELEYDFEPQTAFFEGDIGAITAGITGEYNGLDLPVTGGLIPLLFQNGVWLEDAFIGGAAAIPSMNSPALDISNADITFFAGFDKVTAPGIADDAGLVADSNVNIYGIAAFVETLEGYIEAGYAYLDAEDALAGQDYHSATAAFTKRYGGWLSNSMRVVASFGQDETNLEDGDEQNGVMLLSENSLITSKPYTLLPYGNFFLGLGRPVPAADATGLLRNTGISFETDALTGFPFLDDTGQNAYGGALGIQYLFDLQQQLVFEVALERQLSDFSNSFEDEVNNQYAASVRYQIPISNAWLIRADAIYAIQEDDDDNFGVRSELRFKF